MLKPDFDAEAWSLFLSSLFLFFSISLFGCLSFTISLILTYHFTYYNSLYFLVSLLYLYLSLFFSHILLLSISSPYLSFSSLFFFINNIVSLFSASHFSFFSKSLFYLISVSSLSLLTFTLSYNKPYLFLACYLFSFLLFSYFSPFFFLLPESFCSLCL